MKYKDVAQKIMISYHSRIHNKSKLEKILRSRENWLLQLRYDYFWSASKTYNTSVSYPKEIIITFK